MVFTLLRECQSIVQEARMRYQEKNQKIFAYIQGNCHEILGELIKRYNNQCKSRSFIVNLSHSNELSV